jgi:hypothetical protein
MDLFDPSTDAGNMEETSMKEFMTDFISDKTTFMDFEIENGLASSPNWLDSFFGEAVLNDKMMSDSFSPNPLVKSEHSYSLHSEDIALDMTVKKEKPDMDDLGCVINPNHILPHVKNEEEEVDVVDTTPTVLTISAHPHTLLKPTIIFTNNQLAYQYSPAPGSHAGTDTVSLPPTPPSSHSSDSEGGHNSEYKPSGSSSPVRHSLLRKDVSPNSAPFFMNPIPSSGMLILTEEEKRTLIAEGYPIPQKLPLSKQEEKNLKKIRRKIKNKISAQESRRKKKEYLEGLEKKMENYSQENVDLRKRVDQLENHNRSLLGQLHKLQAMVCKMKPTASGTASTGIMVLVLCFAVLLGAWSPNSVFNATYGQKAISTKVHHQSDLCMANPISWWNESKDPAGVESTKPDNDNLPPDPYGMESVSLPSRVLLTVTELHKPPQFVEREQTIVYNNTKQQVPSNGNDNNALLVTTAFLHSNA